MGPKHGQQRHHTSFWLQLTPRLGQSIKLLGYIVTKRAKQTLFKDIGRILIGLGLMLLSLGLLVNSLEPVQNSAIARQLFQAISTEPTLALLIAALLTWATHSSVATVLLIMSLASSENQGSRT